MCILGILILIKISFSLSYPDLPAIRLLSNKVFLKGKGPDEFFYHAHYHYTGLMFLKRSHEFKTGSWLCNAQKSFLKMVWSACGSREHCPS
jgi:hypothetical protein